MEEERGEREIRCCVQLRGARKNTFKEEYGRKERQLIEKTNVGQQGGMVERIEMKGHVHMDEQV